MLRFSCPSCKAILEAPDTQAGTKVACTKCRQRLQAPTLAMMKTVLAAPVPAPRPAPSTRRLAPPPIPVAYNGARCGPATPTAPSPVAVPHAPQPILAMMAGGFALVLGVLAFPVAVAIAVPWLTPVLAGVGVLLGLYVLVAAVRFGGRLLRLAGLDLLVCGGALAGGILLAIKPPPDGRRDGEVAPKAVEKAVVKPEPVARAAEEPPRKEVKPPGKREKPIPPPPPAPAPDKPRAPEKPPAAEKPLDRLVRRLREGPRGDQILAAQEIGKLGEEGKPASRALCVAAVNDREEVRLAALEALEKVNPTLHKHVVRLLVDGNFQRQLDATHALAKMPKDALPATPVLLARCQKHRPSPLYAPTYRVMLVEDLKTLVALAPDDREVITMLMSICSDKNPKHYVSLEMREAAVQGLLAIGKAHPRLRKEMVPGIIAAVSGRSPTPGAPPGAPPDAYAASVVAIAALGEFGADARDAIPMLNKLKLSPEEGVRDAATAALEKIRKVD